MTLDKLKVGEKAIVVSLKGECVLRKRLLEMGITPETEIMVRKKAPFGDPIQILVRGYELTLRKEEARKIYVYKGE